MTLYIFLAYIFPNSLFVSSIANLLLNQRVIFCLFVLNLMTTNSYKFSYFLFFFLILFFILAAVGLCCGMSASLVVVCEFSWGVWDLSSLARD